MREREVDLETRLGTEVVRTGTGGAGRQGGAVDRKGQGRRDIRGLGCRGRRLEDSRLWTALAVIYETSVEKAKSKSFETTWHN